MTLRRSGVLVTASMKEIALCGESVDTTLVSNTVTLKNVQSVELTQRIGLVPINNRPV